MAVPVGRAFRKIRFQMIANTRGCLSRLSFSQLPMKICQDCESSDFAIFPGLLEQCLPGCPRLGYTDCFGQMAQRINGTFVRGNEELCFGVVHGVQRPLMR